jgi:hypothetical protein
MMVRYAKSYIDQLYDAKDMFALEGVIDVINRDRQLPEQFWLSKRLFAWLGWSGSGIWQYYEAISREDFEAIASALELFGLGELAERYRSGMETWNELECCDELDRWMVAHMAEIESASFQLIASDRHYLYDERDHELHPK